MIGICTCGNDAQIWNTTVNRLWLFKFHCCDVGLRERDNICSSLHLLSPISFMTRKVSENNTVYVTSQGSLIIDMRSTWDPPRRETLIFKYRLNSNILKLCALKISTWRAPVPKLIQQQTWRRNFILSLQLWPPVT